MSAPPETPPSDRETSATQRALFGLVGLALTFGALFFTGLTAFGLGLAFDCDGPNSRGEAFEAALGGMLWGGATGVSWLIVVSLLRMSVGRSAVRMRTWLMATAAVALASGSVAGVGVATQDAPSAQCMPFEMS